MHAAVLVLQLLASAAPTLETRAPARLPSLDQPAPSDPDAPTWYGWESFIADATAACLLGGSLWMRDKSELQTATTLLVVSGVGIYLVGAPGLHLARGRPRAALVDLGMRVGFPLGGLLGGGILALLTQQGGWIIPGFALGILAAIVTDIVGLSWEPADTTTTSSQPTVTAPFQWAPFAASVRGTPVAGLAGVF